MSDFIEGLEHDLVRAAARRAGVPEPAAAGPLRALGERAGRWSLRTVLVAIALSFGVTAGAAAATLLALRGSVIPAPAKEDVPPTQTPVPASSHVSPLRVADPDAGVPPWTLRIARSETGYTCSTVGQVRDGRFGLVGMDGRFRTMAEGVTDACGEEQRGARATLVGARVFEGRRPEDVRTVVSGVAGAGLRSAVVESRDGQRMLPLHRGAFLGVLRGYPENLGVQVVLRFADGHREVEPLGRAPGVVLDPEGGNAWKTRGFSVSGDGRDCTAFGWARQRGDAPQSPAVCGRIRYRSGPSRRSPPRSAGLYFAIRRLADPARAIVRAPRGFGFYTGRWRGMAPRTAVWGAVGNDVRRVVVLAPDGEHAADVPMGGSFVVVLPGSIAADRVRVRVDWSDGRSRTFDGDQGVEPRPLPPERPIGGFGQ